MSQTKKSRTIILTLFGIVIAAYILFPFYLVVLNSFKKQTDIVASPIAWIGASIKQFISNVSSVVGNSNFNFWAALGSSVSITVISLVLLALFGAMAAWVISRNNKKVWATVIYMVFIASMIIPFQVVMLPLITSFRDVGQFVGRPVSSKVFPMILRRLRRLTDARRKAHSSRSFSRSSHRYSRPLRFLTACGSGTTTCFHP